MKASRERELREMIDAGNLHDFYLWPEWRRLSEEVRRIDRGECQLCRAKGRYKRADLVHHINHVKDRPDLALSKYASSRSGGKTERNLISVCRECHETECHPGRMAWKKQESKKFRTKERWD